MTNENNIPAVTVTVEEPTKTESKSQKQRRERTEKKAAAAGKKAEKSAKVNNAKTSEFYRASNQLRGTALFAYTVAIFSHFGLIGKNAAMPIKTFTSFYGSRTAYTHHKSKGRYEEAKGNRFKLSAVGRAWFKSGRVDGKNPDQYVSDEQIAQMVAYITTGKREGIADNCGPAGKFTAEI